MNLIFVSSQKFETCLSGGISFLHKYPLSEFLFNNYLNTVFALQVCFSQLTNTHQPMLIYKGKHEKIRIPSSFNLNNDLIEHK